MAAPQLSEAPYYGIPMYLDQIAIDHFRGIDRFVADLPPGPILIEGDNARGKTTLLEAIFYMVTGRSFRTRTDNDCIPWGAMPGTTATVRGRVQRRQGDTCRIAVAIASMGKSVRIDDKPVEKLGGLWGQLHAVLFTPDDLMLLKGAPGERRRFLDIGLSQIGGEYLFRLQRYHQALKQRNALLKRTDLSESEMRKHLAPWNAQMVEHGLPIAVTRSRFLRALEPRAQALYEKISGANDADGIENLTIVYENFLQSTDPIDDSETTRSLYAHLLETHRMEDVQRGYTILGPHRDDFLVQLGGRPVRDFGSQGQVRSSVLALRLAEAEEMEAEDGESPVLLLDDLASELDPARKERVLALLNPSRQAFLTTTRKSDFPASCEFAAVYSVGK
jgi:DNA replication and repair protein RecF